MPEKHTSAEPPRILIFSEGRIAASHGTGAIVLRNFSRYPAEHLCNAYLGDAGTTGLHPSINLSAARWPASLQERCSALHLRVWNRAMTRCGRPDCRRTLPASRRAVRQALSSLPFQPDLLYGICYGAEGLATLHAVLDSLPPRIPVLLHFFDFWPHATPSFRPLLRALGPRLRAVWAVSQPIAEYVRATTGHAAWVDPAFHVELPALFRTEHRTATAAFRPVLIGNVWNYRLLEDLKSLWRWCQQRQPQLGPIHWHCHPDSVARLRQTNFAPEPELQLAGFLTGNSLWEMLAASDLAIVPFSRGERTGSDYERYSLPSRVTESAAAGLPLFALTGPDTPLAHYLRDKGMGIFSPAAHAATAGRLLLELIHDRARRQELGRRARAVAEQEFALEAFQDDLYARLAAVAAPSV